MTSEVASRISSVFGFERKTPYSYALSGQISAETGAEFMEQQFFLLSSGNLLHSLQDPHPVALLLGGLDQRFHRLWEARTTVAATRIEELLPIRVSVPITLAHHMTSAPTISQRLAMSFMKLIRWRAWSWPLFCHLGRRDIHEHNPEIVQHQGPVKTRKQLPGRFNHPRHRPLPWSGP